LVGLVHQPTAKSDRRDPAVDQAEQAAAQTLRERKILVIEEPHTPAASEEARKPATPEESRKPAAPKDKRVTSVNFCGTSVFGDKPVDDELLAELCHFTDLQSLNVGDCKVTGSQLRYLSGLTKMASLVLSNTSVDDKGLANLGPLEAIESLNLRDTAISDAGLDYIGEPRIPYGTVLCIVLLAASGILAFSRIYVAGAGIAKLLFFVLTLLTVLSLPAGGVPRAPLRNLKVLDLSKTKITDAGIKKLLPLQNLKWLLLAETSISDAGLEQLAPLTELGRLTLNKTKVTAAGMAKLKKSIPKLAIDFDDPNAPRPPQGQPPPSAQGQQPRAAVGDGRPAPGAGGGEGKQSGVGK
jgi:uncharacterized membrane protein YtjA (UPF0391 family)